MHLINYIAKILLSFIITATVTLLTGCPSWANDMAVEVTPLGLFLKEVKDISIEEESLYISQNRVRVQYIFSNNSSRDIETEIAFPIPPYAFEGCYWGFCPDFHDFLVAADSGIVEYRTDTRAMLNGHDYADVLSRMGIAITEFGGYKPEDSEEKVFLFRLHPKDRQYLIGEGLVDGHEWVGRPEWTVVVNYHWTQKFPAHSQTRIFHSYTPVMGFQGFYFAGDQSFGNGREFLMKDACLPDCLANELERSSIPNNYYVNAEWVSYILTTANNWSQPIKRFNLAVESTDPRFPYISFCFDGPVKTVGQTGRVVELNDFRPERDLKIYFLLDQNVE